MSSHRVHGDWHVGNATTEQAFANPSTAQDSMIVHGIRV